MRIYATPHVIIFANFPPDQSKLSYDRWDIRSFGRALNPRDPIEFVPY